MRLTIEKNAILWPGVLEVYFTRSGFGLFIINTGDDNNELDWPWILNIHVLCLELFIHLPFPRRHIWECGFPLLSARETWGLSVADGAAAFHWGRRVWRRALPFVWLREHGESMSPDGSWIFWGAGAPPRNRQRIELDMGPVDVRFLRESWRLNWTPIVRELTFIELVTVPDGGAVEFRLFPLHGQSFDAGLAAALKTLK